MTTIYIPRLIESAEQAEALPVGALAVNWEIPSAAVRIGPDEADGYPWLVNSQNLGWHSHIVGHTALVPIEAEEEVEAASHVMGKLAASGVEVTERTGDVASWQRRYVTPWVEDALPDGWESFTVTGEEA